MTVFPYTMVPSPPPGAGAWGCMDWRNKLLYTFTAGPIHYLFNALSRAQLARVDMTNPAAFPINVNAMSVGQVSGRLYSGTSNSASLFTGYNSGSQTVDQIFNDVSLTLPAIGFVAAVAVGAADIVLGTGLNSGQGSPGHSAPICGVNMSTLTSLGPPQFFSETQTSISPGNASIVRGPAATAYVSCIGFIGGVGPQTIGYYKVTATATTFGVARLGGHTAADFGGTSFQGMTKLVYDATDGNLITCIEVNGAPSTIYLVKLSGVDAHIIWQVALPNEPIGFAECVILAGVLKWFTNFSGGTENTALTATGAISTLVVGIPNNDNNAYWSDAVGLNIAQVASASGANPMWETTGPPLAPRRSGGGVIRGRE